MLRLLGQMLVLVLLIAVGVGVAGLWFYTQSDELLREELLKQAKTRLPNARVAIERVHFDLRGRVHISNLRIWLPEDREPAAIIPELVVTLDRTELKERQRLIVQQVLISQPKLRVTRDGDGRWNWSRLNYVPDPENFVAPDVELQHGHLVIHDAPGHSVTAEDLQITAHPSAKLRYGVRLSLRTESTGPVSLTADVPLESGRWRVQGDLPRLNVDTALWNELVRWAPSLAAQIQPHRQALDDLAARFAVADTQYRTHPQRDLGLALVSHVKFDVGQEDRQSALKYRAEAEIREGQVTHSVLPLPLFAVRGRVQVDPTGVVVRKLQAQNGGSEIEVDGRIGFDRVIAGTGRVQSATLNDAIMTRLPDSLQKIARSIGLQGQVSGTIAVKSIPGQPVDIEADATLNDGSVTYDRFPMPVKDVTGTLGWHDGTVEIHATGRAAQVGVEFEGLIHNPGPACEAAYTVKAQGVPIDDAFLEASPPIVRKPLDALRLTGRADVRVDVYRAAGIGQKYLPEIRARLHDGTVHFASFPYPVRELTGFLLWKGDVVTFQKLRGTHDGAELTCAAGRWVRQGESGRLELPIQAENVAFDRALHAAVPQNLKEVWDAFAPQGRFDAQLQIGWTLGQAVEVTVPQLTVSDAQIVMRDFPFPFQQVEGEFAYDAGELQIRRFTARHDDTEISGHGVAKCHVGQPWEVRLAKLHVDDLQPTPALRRALPGPLRTVVEGLNPLGKFSSSGPVTFFGPKQSGDWVGAEWNTEIVLAGCSLNAGLRLNDLRGRVKMTGRWANNVTDLDGSFELDSLSVLEGHQVTQVKGPWKMHDGQLIVGSASVTALAGDEPQPRAAREERIRGEAYGGEIRLDAQVDFRREPVYRTHLELIGSSLENYAVRHLRGQNNVRGLMNGWMDVRGRGWDADRIQGEGQLQISPAALYELPIFLQIFQLPQFAPINRAAFDYANFFFTIGNQRFNFQSIDLVGNALSLRGRGSVRFDGDVMLDFFSMRPRNQVRLPVLRQAVDVFQLATQGLIAIEVRGPLASPVARVVPLPALDAAMEQFLSALDGRSLRPPPVQPPEARAGTGQNRQ